MGYQTEFTGSFTVDPPLNSAERDFLRSFADTRHEDAERFGDTVSPGHWCHWSSNDDGSAIVWNGREKFYRAAAWLQYLIDVYLAPSDDLRRQLDSTEFAEFTFDHAVSGEVSAVGQDGAAWLIQAVGNTVDVVDLNGPEQVDYVAVVIPRRSRPDLDREFDAAYDVGPNSWMSVSADDPRLATKVRRCAKSVRRGLVPDESGDLVDPVSGLRVTTEDGAIVISLDAAVALTDAERNFTLVQRLVARLTAEFGWIAYDPAQRIAFRPGSEFRQRAIELTRGYTAEPERHRAEAVI